MAENPYGFLFPKLRKYINPAVISILRNDKLFCDELDKCIVHRENIDIAKIIDILQKIYDAEILLRKSKQETHIAFTAYRSVINKLTRALQKEGDNI